MCVIYIFAVLRFILMPSSLMRSATRSNAPGAYINTQWETCQATQEQCLLDYLNPQDSSATAGTCHMGSVSDYMVRVFLEAFRSDIHIFLLQIDVRTPEDVVAAFEFSRRTKVPLVIKNTGVSHCLRLRESDV